MTKKLYIPEHRKNLEKEIVCAVIDAIPAGWAILRGWICAPDAMLASGEALKSTKIVLGSSIDQMINKTENGQVADVFGVLFEGKKPASISFGHLGNCQVMPIDQSKRTAIRFLRLGYRGRLDFRWRDYDDGNPTPYSCNIFMPTKDPQRVMTRITLEANREPRLTDEKDGSTLKPLIEICESMNLPELQLA